MMLNKLVIQHITPNPTIELADSLVEKYKDKEYSEVVSIGGGSTIDVGKYIAWKLNLPHTAVPTTAGTGSEVTKYIVLTINGKKETLADDKFIPTNYILDPNLVVSLPREHTIASGLDTLCHAIESNHPDYSELAEKLVLDNLEKSVENPYNYKYRANMLLAANLAGRAINENPTNFHHGISYAITERYGIPHGLACALSLPSKYYPFLERLGVDRKNILNNMDINWIAEEAFKHPKLRGYPKEDIISSLS